ncbi:response regulator transcription factor [Phycicoccus sp. MAQZ13P-2]|uniref:response regulator n=1 Tax=Phycicoccus mangrovi TaxID=2840470 RepID=UPI001BFFE091|nr:response regulator transcription factor [Phycicoccus mangrovi]MBT9256568.1 response regulator transcription factor [Phycicoccus mangrovi]MBT9275216.1 response regulator transcription factor [Phycicoccus mangrovi]
MSTATVRVALVDDDPLVRAGLTMILGGDPALELVGEAADGADAADLVRRTRPDVVLMDIRMPRRDGIAATGDLLALPDAPKVLVLTTFDADEMVLRALRVGAHGFLLKDTPPARLVEAVHAVAAGEPTLSPRATTALIAAVAGRDGGDAVERRRAGARRALSSLTEREREVALALGRGQSNLEIGGALHLSVATVKAHVGRILTKLGLENRTQVAILVHDAE